MRSKCQHGYCHNQMRLGFFAETTPNIMAMLEKDPTTQRVRLYYNDLLSLWIATPPQMGVKKVAMVQLLTLIQNSIPYKIQTQMTHNTNSSANVACCMNSTAH